MDSERDSDLLPENQRLRRQFAALRAKLPSPSDNDDGDSVSPDRTGHYLERELYQRIQGDPEIFDFLQHGSLDGIWYWGSFSIGALAGTAGDKWSLGFVKETEQQVCAHLDRPLEQLPQQDQRSRAILASMREDESRHAENAAEAGAAELPAPVKAAMTLVSKVMTFTAYRI